MSDASTSSDQPLVREVAEIIDYVIDGYYESILDEIAEKVIAAVRRHDAPHNGSNQEQGT